jgi:tetratricopeptide (TPR) repeat protein
MDMADNMALKESVQFKMLKKMALLISCSGLIFTGISCRKAANATPDRLAVRPTADAIAEADRFYGERTDLVKVRQGIVSLRQAQADDPANYEIAWRLSKFNYFLGAHSDNATEQDKAFREGLEAGNLAVKLQGAKPEGHFWLGANYGGRAKINTLSGLSELEDIKREMEAVLKIDEHFQAGSAYMVLGQMYLQAPRLLGGDVQKAIEYLEKGIKVGPDNALMRLRLAEAYAAAKRDADARKAIDDLLAMKPMPGYEPEYNEAITEAHKLQEKLK